jgi:predicted GIY-YIG superfamily endonuclease
MIKIGTRKLIKIKKKDYDNVAETIDDEIKEITETTRIKKPIKSIKNPKESVESDVDIDIEASTQKAKLKTTKTENTKKGKNNNKIKDVVKDTQSEDDTDIKTVSNGRNHYCYILRTNHEPDKNKTYNGYTVDPHRRIRQHNQEIKGGAKYTKKWGDKSWEMYALLKGFPDHHSALQCEWRIKHPARKKVRPKRYNSPEGRIKGLNEILKMNRWTSKSTVDVCDMNLELWIVEEFSHLITDLPENIQLYVVDSIDLKSV